MTKGEHCVDISFNPSGDKNVDEIKELVEDGAMWAVKSINKQPYQHD